MSEFTLPTPEQIRISKLERRVTALEMALEDAVDGVRDPAGITRERRESWAFCLSDRLNEPPPPFQILTLERAPANI